MFTFWSPVVFNVIHSVAWVLLLAWIAVLAIRAYRWYRTYTEPINYLDWWEFATSIKWHLLGLVLVGVVILGIGGRETAFRPKTDSNAPGRAMIREARKRYSQPVPEVKPPSKPDIMESSQEHFDRNKAEAEQAVKEFKAVGKKP